MTCLWSGARRSRSCIIIIHMDDPVLWRKVYLDYSNNLLFTLFTFSGQNFSAFTQCMYLFKANTLTLVFKSSISSLSVYIEGSLISEDILTLVPLPKKGAKFRPWAESLDFLPFYSKQLIQIFCSGARFGTFFFGNGTKVKIPSEIKQSLVRRLKKKIARSL
jgi:hypothetical protein